MDVVLGDKSGIDVTPEVIHEQPQARVLVLSMQDDPRYVREAFAAGAHGYVLKEAADTELVTAVREVARGRSYVHPALGARMAAADAAAADAAEHDPLSDREREVLRLLALGHTNQEIAQMLFISVRTAETHRAHIMNRAIKDRDLNALYVAGPGHGGPGIVANAYLEGTYSEVYSHIPCDESGLAQLFRQFSFPGGVPSHVAPETPGSIHEGGELGYSLAHDPRPGRRTAATASERRCESGSGSYDSCHGDAVATTANTGEGPGFRPFSVLLNSLTAAVANPQSRFG